MSGSGPRAPIAPLADARQAQRWAEQIVDHLVRDELADACRLAQPVLDSRTPFRLLDRAGAVIGRLPAARLDAFLDRLAASAALGAWPLIGSALHQRLAADRSATLACGRRYAVQAGVWHAADSLGERLPGPGLVSHFAETLIVLRDWRSDPDIWVRRMCGVAVHYWAKRRRGAPGSEHQAADLLTFLEPLFEERSLEAVKGIGWGLKTLGKYYPDPVTGWLVAQRSRSHRSLLLRKAVTYLDRPHRSQVSGEGS